MKYKLKYLEKVRSHFFILIIFFIQICGQKTPRPYRHASLNRNGQGQVEPTDQRLTWPAARGLWLEASYNKINSEKSKY